MWLDEAIASFRAQNEQYISRIPPTVRSVKMGDLMDKYGGDVKLCMEAQAADNCECINVLPLNPANEHSTADPPLLPIVLTTEFEPTPPSAITRVTKKRKRKVKFNLTPSSTNTQGAKKKKREVKINHNQTGPWRPAGVFD